MLTIFEKMLPAEGVDAPVGFIDKPIDLDALVTVVGKLTDKGINP
jgi:hypothetical protein